MRRDIDVPALGAQCGQIGERRLGAGQDHEIRIPRQRRPRRHDLEADVGLGRQRVEVIEIRDPRQPRHRDPDGAGGASGAGPDSSSSPRMSSAGSSRAPSNQGTTP